MEQNKKCPMCAEEISLAATICEYCDARFKVTSTGYCQNCHEVREADGNGQCKVCSKAVVDLRVESRLIEESVVEPLPVSQPRAQTKKTKTGKSRLPIGILAGALIFAVIGVFLWFGRNSISAVSNFLASSTPTVAITLTPTTPPTSTRDLRRENPTNQHRYLYVRESQNWHSANEYCAEQGGHLVTIQDDAENQYIFRLTSGNTWLGATDEVYEGNWVWVSGEPWIFSNWRSGEPDNRQGTDYLAYFNNLPSWNDLENFNLFFVCEWEY